MFNVSDFLLIEDNQVLKTYLSTKDMPETMYRTVQIDDYGKFDSIMISSAYNEKCYI